MTTNAIYNPITQYFDVGGSPLNGGSIYYGVANQNPETNPITVYWDEAATQPAAQPIKTINGAPSRNGTPAMVYTTSDYSCTVRNKSGVLINTFRKVASSNSTLSFDVNVASINNGPLYGNVIINGNNLVAQWGAGGTITAGTAVPTASLGYYSEDRFYSYCTGANVTLARIAGSDATNKRWQYTGAASVTGIGRGTRLEASKTAHMAGQTCTYTIELANSLLTSVTWTAYYANSTDAFGTIGTPTKTQIATGTFTVNSTIAKYSTQIALPSAATTGIEIVLSVGAQTSGTWTGGRWDFRLGSASPTYFEVPDIDDVQRKCQRYLPSFNNGGSVLGGFVSTTQGYFTFPFQGTARVAPTGMVTNGPGGCSVFSSGANASGTPTALNFSFANQTSATILATTTAGSPTISPGQFGSLQMGSNYIYFPGCEIP